MRTIICVLCILPGAGYPAMVNKTREVGENAKILGAKNVCVACTPHKGTFNLTVAQKAVNDFNKAGKILKNEFDITFCNQNHGYEFHPHGNGALMDFIITETDPQYASFEIDILRTFFP